MYNTHDGEKNISVSDIEKVNSHVMEITKILDKYRNANNWLTRLLLYIIVWYNNLGY